MVPSQIDAESSDMNDEKTEVPTQYIEDYDDDDAFSTNNDIIETTSVPSKVIATTDQASMSNYFIIVSIFTSLIITILVMSIFQIMLIIKVRSIEHLLQQSLK